jgi:protein-disulfide isomerase
LVEYGDYQCSSCGQFYLVLKDTQKELGNELRFIFRNFPLTAEHPDAFKAAMAAEAAGCQNKFWEMYDLLFENQANLSDYDLLGYADDLGLNMHQFEQDMQGGSLQSSLKLIIMAG